VSTLASLERRLGSLEVRRAAARAAGPGHAAADPAAYPDDPLGYATNVLGVEWWAKQREVARAVVEHPVVFVKASHGVGKTHLAGGLVSWHFDSFDPGLTLTTAPTWPQVNSVTWREVRLQRRGRGMMPRAPGIVGTFPDGRIDPGHQAFGYTANDAESFQGRHDEHVLLVFEEATGIDAEFFVAAEGILSSGKGNRLLCIMNPTDPASPARQFELSHGCHVITISALDHPNIHAQLRGLPKPFPKAVDLSWVEDKVRKWCSPLEPADARATDVAWPPLDFCAERGVGPQWFRPGPLFEGKVLGRWPTQAVGCVWSDADWLAAESATCSWERFELPTIGCDPARQGDNNTAIHVRRGPVSLHHEEHNGWTLDQTAGRLKQLCRELAAGLKREVPGWNVRPEDIPVNIDCDGLGVGVLDHRGDFRWQEVHGQGRADDSGQFFNKRAELWFAPVERAGQGRLSLARLPADVRLRLKRQAFAPVWKVNGSGQVQVERKEETQKRLGGGAFGESGSPDSMDALNLSYLEHLAGGPQAFEPDGGPRRPYGR
jgi:hypothetical protein